MHVIIKYMRQFHSAGIQKQTKLAGFYVTSSFLCNVSVYIAVYYK